MNCENEIIVDDKEKAQAFNNFFAEASEIDDSNHPLPAVNFRAHNQLDHIEILESDVSDQLQILNVNKAYGPDKLPPRILKEANAIVSKPLAKLFNKSLRAKTFPSIWKKANVLPVFKKGAQNILGNYRPISLLSINSKVFEKIIFKYVYNHFKDNFLISVWQSGFQPSMSTMTQLTELYHQFCKAVSDGKEIRVVFLDISKAFDRVWHKGLLFKLRQFGITGDLLAWFTDYLKDRCQRVIINGQTSNWREIKAGVPQGSNLGPLLFLVFINDIVYVIRHCQIRLFADDTCLYITVDNREEAAEMINEDIASIQLWADQWLVKFSPPKTKTVLISNKGKLNEHPVLKIQGQEIKSVQEHKHLGIVLSHNLRWNAHIDDIVNRCSKKVNMMKAFKYELDRKSLETIYLSFIRPTIEYGDILYAGTYESDLCKLDRIQVDAMRIVTGATERSNIALLYEELCWPLLESRRQVHCLSMMFKIVNGLAPQYLCDLISPRVNIPEGRNLRSTKNDLLPIPFTRTESFRRSYIPHSIRLWNGLNNAIRSCPTIETFKNAYQGPNKKSNNLFYLGKRKPSIFHARLRMGCSKLNAHLSLRLYQCRCSVEGPKHCT